jgi:hypothetical protein
MTEDCSDGMPTPFHLFKAHKYMNIGGGVDAAALFAASPTRCYKAIR